MSRLCNDMIYKLQMLCLKAPRIHDQTHPASLYIHVAQHNSVPQVIVL